MKAKNVVLALAASGLISSQVYAADVGIHQAGVITQQASFSDAEIKNIFESSESGVQMAALSSDEMRETKGAAIPLLLGAAAAVNYAWTAFRIGGVAVGAYRVIGPAYRGGRLVQVMHRNTPIFRVDYHKNPYTSTLHYHRAPNMNIHRPVRK